MQNTAPAKKEFKEVYNDLQKNIDVDDSRGRSVPVNMNFIEEGFLSRDTGVSFQGAKETDLCHSEFNYEKKDGTSYRIRAKGTKLQSFDGSVWTDITGSPTFTALAEFGYIVYDDDLWLGNGVESLYKWDGTTFTEYASAPKGNILEVFEDRLFVSGVTAEPLSLYYSNVGNFTIFSGSDVVKPLGTDHVTNLKNYYGVLMIFKRDSIWKLTFIYDQLTALYIPKLEQQSGNYGSTNRKSVSWVENDLWFFTGREVRSIGFVDQQTGVFGINKSVISEPIKETLEYITEENKEKTVTFYHNRKFYLAVALGSSATTNNTVFVSHLLYANLWTKYENRIKCNAINFLEIDDVVYSNTSSGDYGSLVWSDSIYTDDDDTYTSEVFFKKVENKEFNQFNIYRYCNLMFKDIAGDVTFTVKEDAHDDRATKSTSFYVGNFIEGLENTLGEVMFGSSLVADSFGEEVPTTPFLRRRISFLSKAQSLTVGLSSSGSTGNFTICAYSLLGYTMPYRFISSSNIISV